MNLRSRTLVNKNQNLISSRSEFGFRRSRNSRTGSGKNRSHCSLRGVIISPPPTCPRRETSERRPLLGEIARVGGRVLTSVGGFGGSGSRSWSTGSSGAAAPAPTRGSSSFTGDAQRSSAAGKHRVLRCAFARRAGSKAGVAPSDAQGVGPRYQVADFIELQAPISPMRGFSGRVWQHGYDGLSRDHHQATASWASQVEWAAWQLEEGAAKTTRWVTTPARR